MVITLSLLGRRFNLLCKSDVGSNDIITGIQCPGACEQLKIPERAFRQIPYDITTSLSAHKIAWG